VARAKSAPRRLSPWRPPLHSRQERQRERNAARHSPSDPCGDLPWSSPTLDATQAANVANIAKTIARTRAYLDAGSSRVSVPGRLDAPRLPSLTTPSAPARSAPSAEPALLPGRGLPDPQA